MFQEVQKIHKKSNSSSPYDAIFGQEWFYKLILYFTGRTKHIWCKVSYYCVKFTKLEAYLPFHYYPAGWCTSLWSLQPRHILTLGNRIRDYGTISFYLFWVKVFKSNLVFVTVNFWYINKFSLVFFWKMTCKLFPFNFFSLIRGRFDIAF